MRDMELGVRDVWLFKHEEHGQGHCSPLRMDKQPLRHPSANSVAIALSSLPDLFYFTYFIPDVRRTEDGT